MKLPDMESPGQMIKYQVGLISLAILEILVIVWHGYHPSAELFRIAALGSLCILLAALCVAAFFLVYRRVQRISPRDALPWAWMGAALLFYVIGELIGVLSGRDTHRSSWFSVSDVFWLAFILLFIVGIENFPTRSSPFQTIFCAHWTA
jgi:hypothetical protein